MQDLLSDVSIGALVAALVLVCTLLVLAVRSVRRIRPTARRIEEFLDDWQGEADRPGVPGRLGVMARLQSLEDGQTAAHVDRAAQEGDLWRAIHRLAVIVRHHHPESFKEGDPE